MPTDTQSLPLQPRKTRPQSLVDEWKGLGRALCKPDLANDNSSNYKKCSFLECVLRPDVEFVNNLTFRISVGIMRTILLPEETWDMLVTLKDSEGCGIAGDIFISSL